MSALNVTQGEAELLIVSLNMFADIHRNASGSVPEDVAVLLTKLAPAAPVAEDPPDLLAVEPTDEEVAAHFAEEASTRKKKAK